MALLFRTSSIPSERSASTVAMSAWRRVSGTFPARLTITFRRWPASNTNDLLVYQHRGTSFRKPMADCALHFIGARTPSNLRGRRGASPSAPTLGCLLNVHEPNICARRQLRMLSKMRRNSFAEESNFTILMSTTTTVSSRVKSSPLERRRTYRTVTIVRPQLSTSPDYCDINMNIASSLASPFRPGVSRWDGQTAGALSPEESSTFRRVIDEMGDLSRKAQGLNSALTTVDKLRETDDTIHVICNESGEVVQGFLRLGKKHLFLYPSEDASLCEDDVVCLLDFYVHDSLQRQGIGFHIFQSAMKSENLVPEVIAYDRPSARLKRFLHKHYGIQNCLDQPNRFMVFEDFFRQRPGPRSAG